MPSSPRPTVLCSYHYDPLDRLVDSAPAAEAVIQRFYCKTRLATEIQGVKQTSIYQHQDQLLGQQQSQSGARDVTLLATDRQRSVLHTIDATSSRSFAYTPYGHRPMNGLLSLLGFNGERPDPITGWYLLGNGYRPFNPVLMRFTSPDSLSPFGKGGLNPYTYCGGEPINRRDPNGRSWFAALIKGLNEVLAQTPDTLHPTQKLSKTTINLLAESVSDLGGEKKIATLARKTNIKPDQYLADNSPLMQPLKASPKPVSVASPIEHMDESINALIQREVALVDLKAATAFSKKDFSYFDKLILQTQNLTEKVRELRDFKLGRLGLPSHSFATAPQMREEFPAPPSYENSVRTK